VRSESIHKSRGTWVHKASCFLESKEYQKNGLDIAVPNAVVEGKSGCQAIVVPIGSLNPDPEDKVTCSDYLVGYQMKGAHTLAIEKKIMKDLVMNMEDMYGNKEGVFSATVKLLNRASVYRTISK
jgi:hypothetical protein